MAHALYRPFVNRRAYLLQHGSLTVTTLVYACGLLFKVQEFAAGEPGGAGSSTTAGDGNASVSQALGAALVFLCAAFLLWGVALVVAAVCTKAHAGWRARSVGYRNRKAAGGGGGGGSDARDRRVGRGGTNALDPGGAGGAGFAAALELTRINSMSPVAAGGGVGGTRGSGGGHSGRSGGCGSRGGGRGGRTLQRGNTTVWSSNPMQALPEGVVPGARADTPTPATARPVAVASRLLRVSSMQRVTHKPRLWM